MDSNITFDPNKLSIEKKKTKLTAKLKLRYEQFRRI